MEVGEPSHAPLSPAEAEVLARILEAPRLPVCVKDLDGRIVCANAAWASAAGVAAADPVGRTEERLRDQALHDPLTGLPNRILLEDRLCHALGRLRRESGAVAVLFLDLEGFKAVNDQLGHVAGDAVLRTAATRIARTMRPGDTVARFGGGWDLRDRGSPVRPG